MLIAPALTAGMLAGMVAEQRTLIGPADVEPFHQAAKQAVQSIPYNIAGEWMGHDQEVPQAAVQLLRDPAIVSRQYVNISADPALRNHRVSLLVVHTRDSRDMMGHYPPICYPAQGETLNNDPSDPETMPRPRTWQVGDLTIEGMEYHFTRKIAGGGEVTRTVYNFMVVPRSGIARDDRAVRRAAADYQQRFYGTTQFQLLTLPGLTREQRDEILRTFIGENLHLIEMLIAGQAPATGEDAHD